MHEGYAELFRQAEEKSRRWGLLPLGTPGNVPAGVTALGTLPTVGRAVDSYPYESLEIRLHCAPIHLSLHDDPRWTEPRTLTVGDVEVDGKREYGAEYRRLRQEILGVHRDSEEPYPCHVWLTFPDLHVVDATFFVYRYYDRIPSPWKWSEYLICSDPRHVLSADLPIRYVPMLVGRAAVQALVGQ